MAMNIKDPEAERLVAELAALTAQTKTGAVRQAVRAELDRVRRASAPQRRDLQRLLETEVWPTIPAGARTPLDKAEREALLGIGPDGA
jgi:antitoxin VapB